MKLGRKFQEGGPMPAGAPQGGGEDPMMMLAQGAQEALQSQNCEVAMQVCQMILELMGGAQGGAPAEAAPAEGEPVYRRGGRLVRRINA